MKSDNNFVDRRLRHRFKAKEGSLVKFHKRRLFNLGKPHVAKSGSIIDISLEGLSFQYAARDMWSPDFHELSISSSEAADGIKIDNLPFKAVSDFATTRLSPFMFNRRCGIKFKMLTLSQKHQLQRFIQHYAE